MKYPRFSGLTVCALVLATAAHWTYAEIPNQSQEELREHSSNAFSGKVIRTYERREKKGNFVYTYGVAEISVAHVDKGSDIAANERVFVRYWRKKQTRGRPEPGPYGHRPIPKKNDTVLVYVEGDAKTGFDALSPNGFFERTKQKPGQSDPRQ